MPTKKKSSSSNSSGFRKLKALPCYDRLHEKLIAGVAVEEIGRWLQEDMQRMTDIKRDSLVRQLFRLRASFPPNDFMDNPPVYLLRAIEKMRRGVNELDELEKLYLLQVKRISMDAETENKISKLFTGTNREIALAVDILDKMMSKKMELGLMHKQPDQLNLTGNMSISASEELNDNVRVKLGVVAGKLVDILKQHVTEEEEEHD